MIDWGLDLFLLGAGLVLGYGYGDSRGRRRGYDAALYHVDIEHDRDRMPGPTLVGKPRVVRSAGEIVRGLRRDA